MNAIQTGPTTPKTGTQSKLRLVLETEGRAAPVKLERRGNDVFIVSPVGEIIAALIQMGTSDLTVAVA